MASYFWVFGFYVYQGEPIGLPKCVNNGVVGTFGKNPPDSSRPKDTKSAAQSKSVPLPPPKGVVVKDANVQDLHFVCSQIFPDKASAVAYLANDTCAQEVGQGSVNYVLYELP